MKNLLTIGSIISIGLNCAGGYILMNSDISYPSIRSMPLTLEKEKEVSDASQKSKLIAWQPPKHYPSAYARKVASDAGIPYKLLPATAKVESGFNQKARGSSGEVGMHQLMPNTAKGVGVDPYNLKQNILGAARVHKFNYQRYNGNIEKTIKAYNCGNCLERGQVPESTQRYYKKVREAMATM